MYFLLHRNDKLEKSYFQIHECLMSFEHLPMFYSDPDFSFAEIEFLIFRYDVSDVDFRNIREISPFDNLLLNREICEMIRQTHLSHKSEFLIIIL